VPSNNQVEKLTRSMLLGTKARPGNKIRSMSWDPFSSKMLY
jgi:hypothetical protein